MYHSNKCELIGGKTIYDNKYKYLWGVRVKGVYNEKLLGSLRGLQKEFFLTCQPIKCSYLCKRDIT